MKPDRKEVEDWMREAEAGYELRLPAPVIAALCRTQLAVWDAPSVQVDECVTYDEIAGTEEHYGTVEVGVELVGQRVRIVPDPVTATAWPYGEVK